MTGEWEHQLRLMEHGKFPREKFMAEIVEETKGIVERVKKFEEDDSVARETDIISPTDGKPLRETLRGYKSQDGEFMIYKVIGGRKMEEAEVRELVEKRVGRSARRICFRQDARHVSPPSSNSRKTRRPGSGKPNTILATRSISARWNRSGPIPRPARNYAKSGRTMFCANATDGEWKQVFRVAAADVQKRNLTRTSRAAGRKGQDRFDQRFHLEKRPAVRCVSCCATMRGFAGNFRRVLRKPDKDGKPVERKARAKVDLSKAKVIGESKVHRRRVCGDWMTPITCASQTQDNRQVFKLTKKLCEHEITPDEVKELLLGRESRTLIENFVSKRGNKFAAYLVLSPKKDKAEFEFPPR